MPWEEQSMTDNSNSKDLLALTTEIVAAHVSNNTVGVADLPQLINQVYQSLTNIGKVPAPTTERPQPAVPVKKSIHPDSMKNRELDFFGFYAFLSHFYRL